MSMSRGGSWRRRDRTAAGSGQDRQAAARRAAPDVSDPGELAALVGLALLPVGPTRLRSLLERHGSAAAALAAAPGELEGPAATLARSPRLGRRAARALERLERLDAAVLTESDTRYPAGLRHLPDPPPIVFARGRLELLERPAVAIVGSRRHTEYGAAIARKLARGLSDAGLVVVSGLARGIDGLAHEASLERGTVGVLGCGIDVSYPREHARLQERIATEGLLLSEFGPGSPALPFHFPLRNRVIAALAQGVVVVEASLRSGALITAEHALDLGREVFAVPGPIGRTTSGGTNQLIREGAELVTDVEDVLLGLGLEPAVPSGAVDEVEEAEPSAPADLNGPALAAWQALRNTPRHADELGAAAGLPAAAMLSALLELELLGYARQVAGSRFVRN